METKTSVVCELIDQKQKQIWHLQSSLDSANERVKELETNRIHTCHDQCPKIECVQRRRIEELEAENKKLREALGEGEK